MVHGGQKVMSKAWGELLVESLQLLQVLKLLDFVYLLENDNRIVNPVERNVSGGDHYVNIGAYNVIPVEIVLCEVILLINIETVNHINDNILQGLWSFVKGDRLFVELFLIILLEKGLLVGSLYLLLFGS